MTFSDKERWCIEEIVVEDLEKGDVYHHLPMPYGVIKYECMGVIYPCGLATYYWTVVV